MKVVINRCWGGFGLSEKGILRYFDLKGMTPERSTDGLTEWVTWYDITSGTAIYWNYHDIDRNDPALVQLVEELGKEADGDFSELRVVEIPDDVKWYVDEYDGMESVHERHSSWS